MPITRNYRDALATAALAPAANPQLLLDNVTATAVAAQGSAVTVGVPSGLVSVNVFVGPMTAGRELTVQMQESPTGTGSWVNVGAPIVIPASGAANFYGITLTKPYARAEYSNTGAAGDITGVFAEIEVAPVVPLGADNVFIGAYVSLSDHGLDTVLADLVLAPGSLATALGVTQFVSVSQLPDGKSVADGIVIEIRPASGAEAVTIAGFYLADAATGGNLLLWKPLALPVHLADETQALQICFRPIVDPSAIWEDSITWGT